LNPIKKLRSWCPQPKTSAPTGFTRISQRVRRSKIFYILPVILLISVALTAAFYFASLNLKPFGSLVPVLLPRPYKITNLNWDSSTGQIRFLVENTGDEEVTLTEVYVNETLDPDAAIVPQILAPNQMAEIILSKTYVSKPTQITVRVATSDGLDAIKTKVFYAIWLEQVDWDQRTSKIRAVVKNSGDETVTLSEVYVKGTLDASAIPSPLILRRGREAVITLSGTYMDTHTSIPIKVMTLEGAVGECSSPIYGIWIQSINWNHNTGEIIAYVYSNGYEDVRVNGVFVNGTLDAAATIYTHPTNNVWTITLSTTYTNNPPHLTLKVVTAEGAFAELTSWHPNEF